MRNTKIPWCDHTWNPVAGCFPVSAGCFNCYAAAIAGRFSGPKYAYHGLARMENKVGRWTGKVRFFEHKLLEPWAWKGQKRVFVGSMGDLFHEGIPREWLDKIFAVMAAAPRRHAYLLLTKRPRRMMEYLNDRETPARVWLALEELVRGRKKQINPDRFTKDRRVRWPLPNVWAGITAENQNQYDIRAGALLKAKARVRYVSCEPLVGPIDLKLGVLPGRIDWVIAGAESGRGRWRDMDENWVRSLRNQAKKAGIAFFYKQRRKNFCVMETTPVLDGRRWTELPQ